ncbi:glutathione S-transferase [Sneathiella glossodoripedis]|uniref:glutathione S-transferase n=1 Tax=Sneathiella glossodoripedis TaxID=418853 RepID=UPI00046E9CAC|nr:glutathione S-transferase [Sneathiella glossodoripedis]
MINLPSNKTTLTDEPRSHPVLYSFRRCPYAMRARMMIYFSGVQVEHRDILLKSKPQEMLEVSPKATVPVLVLENGDVLEESRDIMVWAAQQNDPMHLYPEQEDMRTMISDLLDETDGPFKSALDRYKYHVRFLENSREHYREEGEIFFVKLEKLLANNQFLLSESPCMADIGIFPFVRQFANSDRSWFDNAPYPRLQNWLEYWLEHNAFKHIMKKLPQWSQETDPVYYPELEVRPNI